MRLVLTMWFQEGQHNKVRPMRQPKKFQLVYQFRKWKTCQQESAAWWQEKSLLEATQMWNQIECHSTQNKSFAFLIRLLPAKESNVKEIKNIELMVMSNISNTPGKLFTFLQFYKLAKCVFTHDEFQQKCRLLSGKW